MAHLCDSFRGCVVRLWKSVMGRVVVWQLCDGQGWGWVGYGEGDGGLEWKEDLAC